ncbi:MAG: acyl-CoA thioester hydrolase [Thermoplasmata archaeon]|jgi:acyl-CoA thioester hydrolase|nr:acyl-CoA thioester hydrolase [Thermoplasmata archaeon]
MSWPFVVEVRVPWRDLDGAAHVNNAVYFSYFETARTEWYLQARGLAFRVEDLDIILARTSCDFRAQATMGDRLRVMMWPGKLGTTSFTLRYEIRKEDGTLVAEGESVQVCFDYAKNAKKPIPDVIRRSLESA